MPKDCYVILELEKRWPVISFNRHGIVWWIAWVLSWGPDKLFSGFMHLVLKYGMHPVASTREISS